MPDAIFSHPRLAPLYDWFDDDREDLDAYMTIIDELSGHHVLDVGCGTGRLAILLAERGYQVTGVDPEVRRVPGVGDVARHHQVTAVSLPLVSSRSTYTFLADGTEVTSESTLRFRSREDVTGTLTAHGFAVRDVRETPDRPGREYVFLAQRSDRAGPRDRGDIL